MNEHVVELELMGRGLLPDELSRRAVLRLMAAPLALAALQGCATPESAEKISPTSASPRR